MKISKKLLALWCLLINVLMANAQFVSPVIQDSSYGVSPIYSRNTGCDIMTFNNNTYRVSVWGNATKNRGFGWVVDYMGNSYVGTLPLTYPGYLEDPDVCILTKSDSNLLAAVVYYDSLSSNYYLEIFEWKSSILAFSSVNVTNFANAPFGTTLNIDGNSKLVGEFTIVWDDQSKRIFAAVGNTSSVIISTNQLDFGVNPDVSLYSDSNADVVHVCYIDAKNGELTIDDYNFNDLASNIVNTITIPMAYPPTISYKWEFPRIASPGPNGGSPSEWTVVSYEHLNSSTSPSPFWNVKGFNNGGSVINYNTNTANISQNANYYVSVCYSSNYPTDGIYVGWSFYSGNLSYPNIVNYTDYSIALRCNNNAIPIDSLFWQVPYSITNNNYDVSSFLSLAGRHADNELFSTYQNISIGGTNIWDVNYKMIKSISSVTSFKLNQNATTIHLDTSKELIQTSYYSLDGKLLFTTNNKNTDVFDNYFNYFNHFTNDLIIQKSEYSNHTFSSKKIARFNH